MIPGEIKVGRLVGRPEGDHESSKRQGHDYDEADDFSTGFRSQ